MVRIGITGAAGRMGRTLVEAIDEHPQATLGAGKSADGLMAVEWWKKGEIQKIIDYCIQDVKVTRDVFQFGRQNGFVKIQNGENSQTQVPVQWN